jgi:hypothetical protein
MRRGLAIVAGLLIGASACMAANYYRQMLMLPRAAAAAAPAQNNFEWLLHFDEAPGATTFLDSGKTNLTVSTVGAGITNSADGKFGGCANFSQTGARTIRITELNTKLSALGTNDWTLDFLTKSGSTRMGGNIYFSGDLPSSRTFCRAGAFVTTTQCKLSNDGSAAPLDLSGSMAWSSLTNQWVHMAYIRYGNQFYVYTNGARSSLGGSLAGVSFAWSTMTNFFIGDFQGNLNAPEYIDELALRARAVWQHTNFTPPTAAYTTSD